ncbi:MAG: hypothetical protein K2X86_04220 [Cytophagaceae bacterium]|nr:hypothetical protein [Cytophagaceae bacterium]
MEIDRNDWYLLKYKDICGAADDSSAQAPKLYSGKHLLNFGLGFHLNSNAITNDFVKGLLYAGFIENERKDQVTAKLRDQNRFGFEFTGGLNYRYKLKEDLFIIAALNQRQMFNAQFTKDAFELAFRGNKQFAGKTADLSDIKINYFDYQSLFIGAQKKINSTVTAGGGISFIRAGRFNQLHIDRGSLYTDSAGQYLDFDMKFKLAFSESEKFLSSNGLGAAVNFNVAIARQNGVLNFEVRDLGVIQWKDLNIYEGDALYRYDGQDIGNVLNFSDSIFSLTKADSIAANLGIKKKKENLTYFIPASLHVNYLFRMTSSLSMVAGVKYYIKANYIPRIYVKSIYYLNNRFMIAPMIAYGGYGKLDFELGAAKSFKDSFIISANVFYLEYLLLPKKSAGHGFNFSLTKLW